MPTTANASGTAVRLILVNLLIVTAVAASATAPRSDAHLQRPFQRDPYPSAARSVHAVRAAAASGPPVTFTWASQPVLPGQGVLLAGWPLGNATVVEVRQLGARAAKDAQDTPAPGQASGSNAPLPLSDWVACETAGATAEGIVAVLPEGVDASLPVQVRGNGGEPFTVNAPDAWFLFGDNGDSATPGGWIRAVGTMLAAPGSVLPPSLLLSLQASSRQGANRGPTADADSERDSQHGLAAGSTLRLNGTTASRTPGVRDFHVVYSVPAGMAEGVYRVQVDNGAGNSSGAVTDLCTFISTSEPCRATIEIRVSKFPPSNMKVFTVNAVQPGYGRNATEAVQKALAAAQAAGGGEVYFPRGQYFVSGPIIVPNNTLLRGEATQLVSIYFHEDVPTTAPPAYITTSSSDVDAVTWGLQDLTLYVTYYYNNVVQAQPKTNGFWMDRVRIRANSYFALEPVTGQGSRGRNTNWSHAVGVAVMLAGTNLFVRDNDVFASGDVFSTRNNGAAGASYMHIQNNVVFNGGTAHWGISWKQTIFEGNVMQGASTTAMGSNYAQYSHGDGDPHVSNVHHYNNSYSLVWGNDREMMTCDGGGGVYYGPAKCSQSPCTSIMLPSAAGGSQPGGAVCVLAGAGTGQCARVLGNASPTSWQLATAFAVPLDNSSRVSIMPYVGHILFDSNRYSDGGEVQFYATALDCVAANNQFERQGGLSAWGRQEETTTAWDANARMQFLFNTVVEGNHVYNYNTLPVSWPYYPGGSKTIEPWSFGSLTNDQGSPVDPGPPKDFTGALNRFIVFRGNVVRNNGGLVVRGTSANVLVESTVIENSDVGLHVNTTTTEGGIVLLNNTQPAGVPPNYDPYA